MHIHIVPGSFARTAFYDPLREALIAEGYATSITPLPSIGMRHGRPPATMEEDAECIRAATEGLVEQGENVVLVMHSYGGIPGMQSVEGFSRAERERAGKAGGVVRLVYLAAVVPDVGQSVNEIMAPWLEKYREMSYVKVEGDYMSHDPELSAKYTFSDLVPDRALEWAEQMQPQSTISFDGKLSYAAYKDFPVSYIVSTQDMCVPPELQRSMITSVESQSGKKVHVLELESGHCAMVSRPAETAKLIALAAEQIFWPV